MKECQRVNPRSFFYDKINILHQNIAGLLNKSDLLTVQLKNLENQGTTIDVVCITEHFIASGHESLLYLSSFHPAAFFCRKTNRGGTCILVRNGHQYKELPDIAKHSVSGVFEVCAIELTSYSIIVICVYRIPKYNYLTFYEKLDIVLSKLCLSTSKKIVLCGDLNIDTLKRNKATMELENFLLSYNLTLEINQPTRLRSETCIDNFAHNIRRGCKAKIIDLILSDHTSQILSVPINKTCRLKFWKIVKKDYSTENLEKFRECIRSLTFKDVYESNDTNVAYMNFYETFSLFYKLCFPDKIITIYTNKNVKWVSHGIKTAVKDKESYCGPID